MSEFDVDVELLISLVEDRPVLWDQTLEKHKDKKQTLAAWRQIGSLLREDFDSLDEIQKQAMVQLIKRKWYNLRDNWIKSIKKIALQKKSGFGSKHIRKYVFDKQLHFLRKVLEKNENNLSLLSEKPSTNGTEDHETDRKLNLSSSSVSSPSNIAEITTKITRQQTEIPQEVKRRRKAEDDERFRSSSHFKESELENRHFCFFKAILPSVQNFDEDQTIEFQMGVLNLIRNLKAQYILNPCVDPLSNIEQYQSLQQFNNSSSITSYQTPSRGDRLSRSKSFQVSASKSSTTPSNSTNGQLRRSSSSAVDQKSSSSTTKRPISPIILRSPSESSIHSRASDDSMEYESKN